MSEAAIEVFAAKGYAGTTVDDIVKAANATRATFYQYFAGKRDVVIAIVDEMDAKGEAMFDEFVSVQPLTREAVRAWLGRLADFYVEFRKVIAATHYATQEPELAQRVAAAQTRFIDALASRLAPNQRYSPRLRAACLEAQREVIMRWWLIEGWDLDGDEVLEALTDSWAEALGIDADRSRLGS